MSAEPTAHQPHRDSDVAAWIKAARDLYPSQGHVEWDVLDGLLDDYRLHADTGTPLGEHACAGPYCIEGGYHPTPVEAGATEPASTGTAYEALQAASDGIADLVEQECAAWRYDHPDGERYVQVEAVVDVVTSYLIGLSWEAGAPAEPDRCPRCESPQPHLHPAVQSEGEVQLCPHPWHHTTDIGRDVLDRLRGGAVGRHALGLLAKHGAALAGAADTAREDQP